MAKTLRGHFWLGLPAAVAHPVIGGGSEVAVPSGRDGQHAPWSRGQPGLPFLLPFLIACCRVTSSPFVLGSGSEPYCLCSPLLLAIVVSSCLATPTGFLPSGRQAAPSHRRFKLLTR